MIKKITSKHADIPWGPWQEVGTMHTLKKNQPHVKEKFDLTSVSAIALGERSFM